MACKHKFYGIEEYNGLIPNWKCKTLIIGTFNPENKFHSRNDANFFYQRRKNYFWDILPLLSNEKSIEKKNSNKQIEYLKKYKIGLTDLLLSINDADNNCLIHKDLISTVKDEDIERFKEFSWNTDFILEFIKKSKIQAVFFTKLGNPNKKKIKQDTFENQMRLIEDFCISNNVFTKRLHSPTGMGLGAGNRIETLLDRWINENGASKKWFDNTIL